MDTVRLVGALRNTGYLAIGLVTAYVIWTVVPEAVQQVTRGLGLIILLVGVIVTLHWMVYRLGPTHKHESFSDFLGKFWRNS